MRLLLVAVLGTALVPLAARAQLDSREGIALQNQILELRRDVQTLQSQRGGGPIPASPRGGSGGGGELTAQLLDRVTALEDEVRRLRGQLDEQGNAGRRAQDDLAKQIADLTFRLQNAGAAPPGAAGPGSQAGVLTAPGAPAASPRRTPELAMQEGNAALARRDYPAAEAAAREVLAAGRTTPRGGDAQFLLAQSQLGQRNFQAAAVAYDDAYNRSRTGSRAPDALLGLATAMAGLNERPATCATLDKLRTEFPSTRPDIRDQSAALRARAGCR